MREDRGWRICVMHHEVSKLDAKNGLREWTHHHVPGYWKKNVVVLVEFGGRHPSAGRAMSDRVRLHFLPKFSIYNVHDGIGEFIVVFSVQQTFTLLISKLGVGSNHHEGHISTHIPSHSTHHHCRAYGLIPCHKHPLNAMQ